MLMGVLLQITINSLLAGSLYALIASGFSLLFNVQKFVDLSYGSLYAISAYVVYFFFTKLNIFFPISIIMAMIISSSIGLLFYTFIYDKLRKKKENRTSLLLASFGILTLIEGLLLLLFGASPRSYGFKAQQGISLFGASITKTQIGIIFTSVIILLLLLFLLKKTKLGIAIRAISDNKIIASTIGINFKKISTITIIIASILASIASISLGLDQGIHHTMGLKAILFGFTSAIIGGIGNVAASMLGGFLLGIIENFGIVYLPSEFKDAIAYIVLITFLLLRPQGMMGIKTREEVAG